MLRFIKGFAPLILLYLLIAYGLPKPVAVKQEAWQLFAVFAATVAGLILQPVPGGAMVLIGVICSAVVGGLPIQSALSGYSDPMVWLVLTAFLISRALLNTGLARRIALLFVRLFGKTSVGITYALAATDALLATIIPSNGARSGGVTLPIARSIAELYSSTPGPTARRLGAYLMASVYQSVCVGAAMFFTGQASNPIAAQIAGQNGFPITWASWFVAGSVPGLVSLALIPLLVMKLYPPEIRKTPEAAAFAAGELQKMGPMSKAEQILAVVFIAVCGLWATAGHHGLDITVTALLGAVALLLTGVLTWEDVKSERTAWDLFVWYGGLVRLGKALNDGGVMRAFADSIAGWFGDTGWPVLFVVALLLYFYSHYAYASITAHLLSMYPPFLAVLVAKGAPVGLVAFAFACYVNFASGLTNYGTTPAPIFFAQEYVSMKDWFRIGAVVSVANVVIWGTIGFGWWKLLGIW
ncbi:MAG TPA: DASS family sodium-coupled anion symporter [Bryobacteraceae bacterium]|nr:DASS family sodium-coupled anion symporter [Bryobacteraceae bacterium]